MAGILKRRGYPVFVARAAELARELVDYDEQIAMRVLEQLCADLGGPAADGESDVARMKAFLAQPDPGQLPEVGDPRTTTAQWKEGFGRYEATRALASALASLLDR